MEQSLTCTADSQDQTCTPSYSATTEFEGMYGVNESSHIKESEAPNFDGQKYKIETGSKGILQLEVIEERYERSEESA